MTRHLRYQKGLNGLFFPNQDGQFVNTFFQPGNIKILLKTIAKIHITGIKHILSFFLQSEHGPCLLGRYGQFDFFSTNQICRSKGFHGFIG